MIRSVKVVGIIPKKCDKLIALGNVNAMLINGGRIPELGNKFNPNELVRDCQETIAQVSSLLVFLCKNDDSWPRDKLFLQRLQC